MPVRTTPTSVTVFTIRPVDKPRILSPCGRYFDTPKVFDVDADLSTCGRFVTTLLSEWWWQVGRHQTGLLRDDEVMAPAPGTMLGGMDVAEVARAVREWVAAAPAGYQHSTAQELRDSPWYLWLIPDPWMSFQFRTPAPPVLNHPGHAMAAAGNHFVIEARWSWMNMSDPCALLVAPKSAAFSSLVPLLLHAVDLDEDGHGWHFQIYPDRSTSKQPCGLPIDRGARLTSAAEAHAPTNNRRWRDADTMPLDWALAHGDQFWWAFDYGDAHLFRLRALDGNRAGVDTVHHVQSLLGIDAPWSSTPQMVQSMPGRHFDQYQSE